MQFAIVGAGIGGLATGVALSRLGYKVDIYEQASAFGWVGTGITLSPNAVRVVDGMGLGAAIRTRAHQPPFRENRTWDTGEITALVELGVAAERKFGAPLLCLHRADFLAALEEAFPHDRLHFGKRLVNWQQDDLHVQLLFADGSHVSADGVIGADGIHSRVRDVMLGPEQPRYRGVVAYRTVIPVSKVHGVEIGPFIKWWGPRRETEIIAVPLGNAQLMYAQVTTPENEWRRESWSMKDDGSSARKAASGFHDGARSLFDACDEALVSALYDRDPIRQWSSGRVALLGDACHPMLPFMAQGAAMTLEDVEVLTRCLEAVESAELPIALKAFELSRRDRATKIQTLSRENEWGRTSLDIDWVYGFDSSSSVLTWPE